MKITYKIIGSVFLTFAMSSSVISDDERPERPERPAKERPERPAAGSPERPAAGRPERPARGGRNERPAAERPARGGRPERPAAERPARGGRPERPAAERPARGGRNDRTASARRSSRDRAAVAGNAPLVMNQIMGLLKDRANARGIDRRTLLEAIDKLDRNGDSVFTADELLGARVQRP